MASSSSRNERRDLTILKQPNDGMSAGVLVAVTLGIMLAIGSILWAVSGSLTPAITTDGYGVQQKNTPSTTGQGG
jgi:hypothetical protein